MYTETSPIITFIFVIVLVIFVALMLYTGHLDKKREERKKKEKC